MGSSELCLLKKEIRPDYECTHVCYFLCCVDSFQATLFHDAHINRTSSFNRELRREELKESCASNSYGSKIFQIKDIPLSTEFIINTIDLWIITWRMICTEIDVRKTPGLWFSGSMTKLILWPLHCWFKYRGSFRVGHHMAIVIRGNENILFFYFNIDDGLTLQYPGCSHTIAERCLELFWDSSSLS